MKQLRIYLEESIKHDGKPAYTNIMEYLRAHDFAGATVVRGIEGFGRHKHMHNANLLELSTDLPVIVEVIESDAKIAKLKSVLAETGMAEGALITETEITQVRLEP
jgi:PII-like signaling protein